MSNFSFDSGVFIVFYNRLVNLFLAVIVVVLIGFFYQSNHSITSIIDLEDSSSKILVKVSGNVLHPGIYAIADSRMTDGVIKMANNGFDLYKDDNTVVYDQYFKTGSDIRVADNGIVTVGEMPVKQRIILHIPLKISEMSESDLLDIPGIGPGLANSIISYRQNNGGKMELIDLKNVSGIGVSKYTQLREYFN